MKAPTGLLVIVVVVAALAVAGCTSSPATTSTVGSTLGTSTEYPFGTPVDFGNVTVQVDAPQIDPKATGPAGMTIWTARVTNTTKSEERFEQNAADYTMIDSAGSRCQLALPQSANQFGAGSMGGSGTVSYQGLVSFEVPTGREPRSVTYQPVPPEAHQDWRAVWSTSQDSTTGLGASTTTAISPGRAMDFGTFTQRFETLITQRNLFGTLPFTVIPGGELSWLSEAAKPVTVTEAKGYVLANGDTVILLFTSPDFFTVTGEVQTEVFRVADESIMAALQYRYLAARMLASECDFGYLVASKDSDLGGVLVGVAQEARLGPSPPAENGNTPPSVAPPYTVAPVGLSAEERLRLDSLDAPGVIRTYFETADPRVVYYLSTPHEQAMMTAPNYVGEQRHEGDIANLTLEGPTGIDPLLDAYPRTDWPIQEQFVVEYDLLVAREQSAQEAGPQLRFVYVGRQTPDSPWRVMGAGTGP